MRLVGLAIRRIILFASSSTKKCRQKHYALLDICTAVTASHLRRTNNQVHAPFKVYLDYAITLGENRMSHTAWTSMLSPDLLRILDEANKVAGLDVRRNTAAYRRK